MPVWPNLKPQRFSNSNNSKLSKNSSLSNFKCEFALINVLKPKYNWCCVTIVLQTLPNEYIVRFHSYSILVSIKLASEIEKKMTSLFVQLFLFASFSLASTLNIFLFSCDDDVLDFVVCSTSTHSHLLCPSSSARKKVTN